MTNFFIFLTLIIVVIVGYKLVQRYRRIQKIAKEYETFKKVLVVEDFFPDIFTRTLSGKVKLLIAQSIEEATQLFNANPDIDIIIMDACVPGNELNTVPLVQLFRKTFTGPIITASSVNEYNFALLEAGCSHNGYSKEGAAKTVLNLIK